MAISFRETMKALEMRVRALAPDRIKMVYRALRSFPTPLPSQHPPAELLTECEFCASRFHMLDRLPADAVVAEVGTYRGDFAREIVARCRPRELHLIDIDYTPFEEQGLNGAAVHRHCGLSREIMQSFPDGYFDWVYIDADHSYSAVTNDAAVCASKVRPGGFLVFNDFAHIDPHLGRYGVHRAVMDFANERRWPFRYFAFHESGLYDVALRRPQNEPSG